MHPKRLHSVVTCHTEVLGHVCGKSHAEWGEVEVTPQAEGLPGTAAH